MLYVKGMEINFTLHKNESPEMLYAETLCLASAQDFLEWDDTLYLRFNTTEFTEIGWIHFSPAGRFVKLRNGILFQPKNTLDWTIKTDTRGCYY